MSDMDYYSLKMRASQQVGEGEQKREQHIMFEGAVFCYRTPQTDGSYRLSPLCVYQCFKGQWAKALELRSIYLRESRKVLLKDL